MHKTNTFWHQWCRLFNKHYIIFWEKIEFYWKLCHFVALFKGYWMAQRSLKSTKYSPCYKSRHHFCGFVQPWFIGPIGVDFSCKILSFFQVSKKWRIFMIFAPFERPWKTLQNSLKNDKNLLINIESVWLPQKLVTVGTFLPCKKISNQVYSIFYR